MFALEFLNANRNNFYYNSYNYSIQAVNLQEEDNLDTKDGSYNHTNNDNDASGDPGDPNLKPDDLEAVAVLYDCVRDLYKEQDENSDKVLAEQFDTHVRNVMNDLGQKINTKNESAVANSHVLKVNINSHMVFKIKIGKICPL